MNPSRLLTDTVHLYVIKGFLSSLPVLCEDGGGLVKKKKQNKTTCVRSNVPIKSHNGPLAIIPRAQMGSESIAHETEKRKNTNTYITIIQSSAK